jgi:transcription antitermination protein NusB
MTRPRGDRSGRARSLSRRLALQALYQQLLQGVVEDAEALDAMIGAWLDRPVTQLDPVEHAVLLIGVEELRVHVEVPYKVVLNECVELAKKFGATDGHKFINAVLDRAARQLRAAEQQATPRRLPGK